jgi:hypothetical protein
MNLLGNARYSPHSLFNPCLDSEGQFEETEGSPENYMEVYYEEPDLSGGVEGIDCTISYGPDKGIEEEADT